jgi:hypothetical protein
LAKVVFEGLNRKCSQSVWSSQAPPVGHIPMYEIRVSIVDSAPSYGNHIPYLAASTKGGVNPSMNQPGFATHLAK